MILGEHKKVNFGQHKHRTSHRNPISWNNNRGEWNTRKRD